MVNENNSSNNVCAIPAINLFVTPHCNMRCRFCFGSCKMQHRLSPAEQFATLREVIRQCKTAGIRKITFVGGEPLLYKPLTQLVNFAHERDLTTCVVTNGALVTKDWLKELSDELDWIGYSIDSLNPETNVKIGRTVKGTPLQLSHYQDIVDWTHEAGIRLKTNTTVCSWNQHEDMSCFLLKASPERIKFFQATTIKGVNSEQSDSFSITEQSFKSFVARHEAKGLDVVSESEEDMTGSYLMVSPDGRFFDNITGTYRFSSSIIKVGIQTAYNELLYDPEKFYERGGEYDY